ncbi:hypothetical protein V8D89_003861 [Ganoderma adspersum]
MVHDRYLVDGSGCASTARSLCEDYQPLNCLCVDTPSALGKTARVNAWYKARYESGLYLCVGASCRVENFKERHTSIVFVYLLARR